MMDLTQSIEPRSDQINSDDLISGPHTYTVREVVQGKAEQPFDFMLHETERAYRPSKTMRRMIVAAWGPDTKAYSGRRLTLYREPSIKFGSAVVGGIRISHMSHIAKRIEEKFQTTRGKRETFTVEPLPDVPKESPPPAPDTRHMVELFGAAGITEKAARLEYCHLVVGHDLKSAGELSPADVQMVCDSLDVDIAHGQQDGVEA